MSERVDILINAKDNASRNFNRVNSSAKNLTASLIGPLSLGYAVLKLGQGMNAAVAESEKLKNAQIGLQTVAKAFGQDQNDAADAAIRLSKDGLLTVAEAAEGLKNLLPRMGLEEAEKVMRGLTDAASFNRQGTLQLGQAVVGATQGVKNLNSIMVDNAGVTKNLSIIMKESGFTMQDLDDANKKAAASEALVNGLLKETNVFAGDSAKIVDTLSGKKAKLATESSLAAAAIGDLLTPAYEAFIEIRIGLAQSLKSEAESIKLIGDEAFTASLKFEMFGSQVLNTAKHILMGKSILEASGAASVDVAMNFEKEWEEALAKIEKRQKEFNEKIKKDKKTDTNTGGGEDKKLSELDQLIADITKKREKEKLTAEATGIVLSRERAKELKQLKGINDELDLEGGKRLPEIETGLNQIIGPFEEINEKVIDLGEGFGTVTEKTIELFDATGKSYKVTHRIVEKEMSKTQRAFINLGDSVKAALVDNLTNAIMEMQSLNDIMDNMEETLKRIAIQWALNYAIPGGGDVAKMMGQSGINFPMYQSGGIPKQMPIMAHQGERLLSNTQNREIVDKINKIESKLENIGNGGITNIYAMDSLSFEQFMRRKGNAVLMKEKSRGRLN